MLGSRRMALTTSDHSRDSAGLTYVYPVISRRSHGVSIGVNLNTNNACNWRCVYCQVPDLTFGNAPETDLSRLDSELSEFLDQLVNGTWLEENVPEDARTLRDIAFSGNGEPTSSPQFADAIDVAARAVLDAGLADTLDLVLITNGSLLHKEDVRRGVERLAAHGGVVWFKLDSATLEGQAFLNNAKAGLERTRDNLVLSAELCTTWLQTMMLAVDGEPPSEVEQEAYLEFLRSLVNDKVPVRGVLLYGLARPSLQPEAPRLSALSADWLRGFARRVEETGLPTRVAP